MAIETQSSPESVVTSISRPKSARTPPSAFPFLQIQLSKSKIQKSPTTTRPAADRRFFPRRRDPHRHDRLGTARVSRVECPARAARPCSPPTRLFKQHTDPSVNTRFKKSSKKTVYRENNMFFSVLSHAFFWPEYLKRVSDAFLPGPRRTDSGRRFLTWP